MKRNEAETYRAAIVMASESLSDEVASTVPDLFDAWKTDTDYAVCDRRRYGEILYKCLIAHRSQSTWTPDVSPSLWVRTDEEEYPEWRQPTGATDAYNTGDKVSHNGKHWISNIDGNVWEPGAVGSELLWSER